MLIIRFDKYGGEWQVRAAVFVIEPFMGEQPVLVKPRQQCRNLSRIDPTAAIRWAAIQVIIRPDDEAVWPSCKNDRGCVA